MEIGSWNGHSWWLNRGARGWTRSSPIRRSTSRDLDLVKWGFSSCEGGLATYVCKFIKERCGGCWFLLLGSIFFFFFLRIGSFILFVVVRFVDLFFVMEFVKCWYCDENVERRYSLKSNYSLFLAKNICLFLFWMLLNRLILSGEFLLIFC